jgi:hypothetical protein
MPENNHISRRLIWPLVVWPIVLWPIFLVLAAFAQERVAPSAARPSFRITGTVVSALTAQPLAHAEVEIGLAMKSETVQSLVTTDDGRFQFDGLLPGKYWLRAARNGFSLQGFDEHEGYFTGIVVGPGLLSEDLIFRLRPDASISGMITDEQNEPVRDAQVMLFRSGIENGRRATTLQGQVGSNDQGRYRFSHLSPGTYFVAVSARPWYAQGLERRGRRFRGGARGLQPPEGEADVIPPNPALDVAYPLTLYSGTTDVSSATPIILKAGDRASADVALTAVRALTLRIHDPSVSPGQPFGANLEQHVFEDRAIPVPQDNVQIDKGQMVISGLPPGEFVVNVQSFGKDNINSNDKDPNKDARSWRQVVSLSSDTDITTPAAGASAPITGVVTLGGMPPGRRAYIQLNNRASGNNLGAEVSAKGEFEIPSSEVRPGTYQISVVNLPDSIVAGVTASGAKVLGQSVVITGAGPVRLTVTMSEGLATLTGVAMKDEKTWAGAMIVLVPQNPENNTALFRRDQSDSDGSFNLRQVLPGKYTALAIENGWDLEWANPSILKPYMKDGQAVEISAGRKYEVKLKVQ